MNRTFDRLPSFDERSRSWPILPLLAGQQPRSYTWSTSNVLNQGNEGACVGFAWCQELASKPKAHTKVADLLAREVYWQAQREDEWPGENYSGTSVLAGAKVAKARGYLGEYRWCFSVDEVAATVSRVGPVVLGLDWHDGMLDTNERGYIVPSGRVVGGHAIVCVGFNVRHDSFLLCNSWGEDWGMKGRCRITMGDLGMLLASGGEACVPVGRRWIGALR